MVTTLMMSANLATQGLFRIKTFSNKGYDAIISVHDVTREFYHLNQITW